jgi:hypothetical protein
MYNQFLLLVYYGEDPPNALRQEKVLSISGVGYNILKCVYNNVLVAFEDKGHRRLILYQCGAASTES